MNLILTVVVVVCAFAMVAVLFSRRSRASQDGVAEFRRQLGALSPDASRSAIRPTVVSKPVEGSKNDESEDDDGA